MEFSDLKGIGPARQKAFHAAGICSLRDLLYTLPVRYRDTSRIVSVAECQPGEKCCLKLRRDGPPKLFRKGKLCRVTCRFIDETGAVDAVWFNQVWRKNQLETVTELMLYGPVELYGGRRQLLNPSVETEPRIIPVYRPLEGIPQKTHETAVRQALEAVEELFPETLPGSLRARYSLMPAAEAIRVMHQPPDPEKLAEAKRRFAFEQMLLYQTAVRLAGELRRDAPVLKTDPELEQEFWHSLPFEPTNAQRRTLGEILRDMGSGKAMARMVQGDVGSGKTAVAMGTMLAAVRCGYQAALMVPTEILARQHFASMREWFAEWGITCGLLLGGCPAAERRAALEHLQNGEWQAVIGTHALIEKGVQYARLGLCITDEQHRFGVAQRTALINKGTRDGLSPHLLVMSATPIPRSLALVLYGDLAVSVMDELPPGRLPVATRIVPEEKRQAMYGFIRKALEAGRQAYFVCPLVEVSEGEDSLKSAREHARHLAREVFPEYGVGLTYGTQPSAEKAETLEAFASGKIRVLAATTVIEVGVNVPNATIMVIEDADRFGLAQLHQLRGRVGRGSEQSWCFLLAKPNERLQTLVSTNDGFKVAQADLEQRGPGELLGTRQHGDALLPGAAAAFGSMELLYQAAECARQVFEEPRYAGEKEVLSGLAAGLVEQLNSRVSIS